MIYKDDASQPGNAVEAVKSFASQGVAAIVSVSTSDSSIATTVSDVKIPVVGVFSNDDAMMSNKYFYPEGQTSSSVYNALALIAKSSGITRLGNIYCAEISTCSQSQGLLQRAGSDVGIPVEYSAAIDATAPNYTAQCLAAQQAHVDGLVVGDAFTVVERVAADCARQGYQPAYLIQGAGAGPNMLTAEGIKKLLIQYADLPYFADSPAVQEFNKAMDKYFPGVRQQADNFTEDTFQAWVSGKMVGRAIELGGLTPSGTPSSQEILNGLDSFKGETLDGLAPPLTFRKGSPHTVNCWFTGQVVNGKATLINNGKVSCKSG